MSVPYGTAAAYALAHAGGATLEHRDRLASLIADACALDGRVCAMRGRVKTLTGGRAGAFVQRVATRAATTVLEQLQNGGDVDAGALEEITRAAARDFAEESIPR